jgi:hypothetical protein
MNERQKKYVGNLAQGFFFCQEGSGIFMISITKRFEGHRILEFLKLYPLFSKVESTLSFSRKKRRKPALPRLDRQGHIP